MNPALAGNRTRASRVAGENSTTEPPVLGRLAFVKTKGEDSIFQYEFNVRNWEQDKCCVFLADFFIQITNRKCQLAKIEYNFI